MRISPPPTTLEPTTHHQHNCASKVRNATQRCETRLTAPKVSNAIQMCQTLFKCAKRYSNVSNANSLFKSVKRSSNVSSASQRCRRRLRGAKCYPVLKSAKRYSKVSKVPNEIPRCPTLFKCEKKRLPVQLPAPRTALVTARYTYMRTSPDTVTNNVFFPPLLLTSSRSSRSSSVIRSS